MRLGLSTESLARAAARRPWLTIGVWLAVLVAAFISIGSLLGSATTTDTEILNDPESKRADDILDKRLGGADTDDEIVIVRSSSFTVDDPEYRAHVEALFANLMSLGDEVVAGGATYYMTGAPSMVSADRHSTLIPLIMPAADSENNVESIHAVVDQANGTESFEVLVTGDATWANEAMGLAEKTMTTGETIGISVALIILALVFGAIAAAVLPIVLGLVAVVAALGLAALIGQAMELTFFVTNMITMMGLAVGIDYSLFIVSRYREERHHGLAKIEAIAGAGASASRSVLFSGMTVVLALCGMVIFPLTIFQTMGIGAILVVTMAVLASLTLLPAILSLLGDKVDAWRIPFIQSRRSSQASEAKGGFWNWTTRTVTRHPVVSLIIVVGLLAAAAIPYMNIQKGMSGISALPDDLRAKKGFTVLQEEFGFGLDDPAVVVIDGQTDSPAIQVGIAQLQTAVASDPAFVGSAVEVRPEADLSVVRARLARDAQSQEAMDAVTRLRSDYIPQSFSAAPAEVLVTGPTAGTIDFNKTTDQYTPIIFAFVLGLSFVLLTVAFRSIVLPIKAILMNLLSVAAAYGMIVLVFQKGMGADLLGFKQVDVIESWLPLFLFAILFGLSMDYHVFLLSRVRERFAQTGDNTEAVTFGLRSTGRLITGAALIMVAVFGGFALGDMVMFQQMGFGLAVAVLMDATLVRCILVPAAMKLLGTRNWYMPQWLSWIPNVSVGEGQPEAKKQRTAKRAWKPAPVEEPVLTAAAVPVTVNLDEETATLNHPGASESYDIWA